MTAVVSRPGRFLPATICGFFWGYGFALWLFISHDWRWWTAVLTGWLVSLGVIVLALHITAPDDGRATRSDDPPA